MVNKEIEDPEDAAKQAAASLEAVGRVLAVGSLNPAAGGRIAESLGALGVELVDTGLEAAARQAVKSLEAVGRATVETADKDLGFAAKDSAKHLGKVGEAAAIKGLEAVAKQAVESLEAVGLASVDKNLHIGAWYTLLSLEAVGLASANKGFKSAERQAVDTIVAVGKAGTEKGLDLAEQAARSLAFLSLSSEDLVNLTGLDDSNSAMILEEEFYLAEQKRASFQRFKDLCEENLKRFLASQKEFKEEA